MKESSKIIDSFVLYGVLGDLSVRKLIPAWYYLERDSMLSGSLQILGVGRKKISDSELKNTLKKSLETYVPTEYLDQTIVSTLIDRFSYCSCDLQSPDSYQKLKMLTTTILILKIYCLTLSLRTKSINLKRDGEESLLLQFQTGFLFQQ